jgi:chromosome partitioning protein
MIDKDNDGLIQRTISVLSNVSTSTVSRCASANNLIPFTKSPGKSQKFPIQTVRKIISNIINIENHKIIKKKFVFYNFKGGVGKTSLCFQISSHMAFMGYKVLVIDADPQGHLSTSFGFFHEKNYLTLYDLIVRREPFVTAKKVIFEGFDCIPSNLSLTRLEDYLTKTENNLEKLSSYFLDIEKDYDFIFIDTNPTISLLNRNIVIFSDVINTVCETQPYSLNGIKLLLEDLDMFYKNIKINPRDVNIIPNKYEDRSSSSAEAMTALREYYGGYVKKDFAVRKSEDINTSAKLGKPLGLFAKKNSIALEDIVELLHYFLSKYTEING